MIDTDNDLTLGRSLDGELAVADNLTSQDETEFEHLFHFWEFNSDQK